MTTPDPRTIYANEYQTDPDTTALVDDILDTMNIDPGAVTAVRLAPNRIEVDIHGHDLPTFR